MRQTRSAGVEIDGAKLRELRQLSGDRLVTFAPKCGISKQYLSQIERGDRPRVSPPTYARICLALGVNRRTLLRTSAA
ncbi:helix-turn-helix domain-containing protein [Micromonospora sp. NPDC048930]|uniref:helix-turn-helix domain-containing protein n=1 Tax=Micromonospora sp. NPDC048930 TaxID=3364261 RepID=UPI00371796CB